MRKILTTLFVVLFITAMPLSGQSFLDKALKKIEKGLDALDGKKQPARKTNQESGATQTAAKEKPPVPVEIKRQSDLQKNNIKGRVKSIVETLVNLKTVTTYTYGEQGNGQGMLLTMDTKDNNGGEYSYSGTVVCEYDKPQRISGRKVTLKNYLAFDKTTLSANEDKKFTYDPITDLLKEDYESLSKTKTVYTYDKDGKLVRSQVISDTEQMAPLIYVYGNSGKLTEIHSGEISDRPLEKFFYNTKEQLSRHDDPSDVITQYQYNDKGDVSWARAIDRYTQEEFGVEFFAYTYDEQGNWTKRLTKDKKAAVTATVNRVITYY